MDVPPSRYRVVEKDGRLIVIDTSTGAATGAAPAAPMRSGSAPAAPVNGLLDRVADAAAQVVGTGRDPQGRMIVAWEWTQNGKVKRWDAALDPAQQRRLGRSLLSIVAPIPLAVVLFLAGQPFIGFVIALPLILSGGIGLNRLQSETQA